MKLSGRGHRIAHDQEHPDGGRPSLAGLAAALQLMRGRYTADPFKSHSAFLRDRAGRCGAGLLRHPARVSSTWLPPSTSCTR
jgi:hypothetical protein